MFGDVAGTSRAKNVLNADNKNQTLFTTFQELRYYLCEPAAKDFFFLLPQSLAHDPERAFFTFFVTRTTLLRLLKETQRF